MEKYDNYKDSGIEWIGEIPEHWEIVPIKYSLLIPLTDGPHETPELIPDGIPFISAEAIKNDKIDFNKKRGFISIEEHERFSLKYKPQVGDVYMIKSGATTGNLARVQTNEEFNIWSPLAAFRPAPNKTTTDFLFFYMKSSRFFSAIELGWNYGTQQNIGMNVLENLRMVRPTIQEQTAIANYLDCKTTEIDELIADKKRLLELYEEEKTAIINQAVTKGINPDAPMKDSGIEWLGVIPEHWEVKKLKYVANSSPSNVDKKSKEGEKEVLLCNYVDVYKNDFITSEIQFMKATASDSQIEKFKLKKGDVIATKDSESPDDIAIPALVREDFENVICGYHLNFIRPIDILGDFLFRFFQSEYTKGYFFNAANGVTRYGIGTEKFSNFVVCVPPIEEQQSIVHHIETECALIDSKSETTKKLIDLLTEYRTALISEVVTGKIKVI